MTRSRALRTPGLAAQTAGMAFTTRAAVAVEPGSSPPLSAKSSWTGGLPSMAIRVSRRSRATERDLWLPVFDSFIGHRPDRRIVQTLPTVNDAVEPHPHAGDCAGGNLSGVESVAPLCKRDVAVLADFVEL